MKWLRRAADWFINLFLAAFALFTISELIQIFCYTSFKIPTDSMVPTLLPGDNILVEKYSKGARLFDVVGALKKEEITIHRVPGFAEWKRGDVLVFNYPYPDGSSSIVFDVMKFYVKRCIGLPGDTLSIRNGYFKVNGVDGLLGNEVAQHDISLLPDSGATNVVMKSYPWDSRLSWTIKEFGPLWIPKKGMTVPMDSTTLSLYARLIEWEQRQMPEVNRAGAVVLGDSVITSYCFRESYYFMAGDNGLNSRDSRYWGLVPESFIVGKAVRVWKSVDKTDNSVRWKRILKKIE
jgi:signal peptidase I